MPRFASPQTELVGNPLAIHGDMNGGKEIGDRMVYFAVQRISEKVSSTVSFLYMSKADATYKIDRAVFNKKKSL